METLVLLGALVADYDVTRFGGGSRIDWVDEQHILIEVSGSVARSMRHALKPNIARDRCRTLRIEYTEPRLISMPFHDEEFCVFSGTAAGSLTVAPDLPMAQEGQVEKHPWTRAKFSNGTLQVLNPPSTELLREASPGVCGEYRTRRGGIRTQCSFQLPGEWLR